MDDLVETQEQPVDIEQTPTDRDLRLKEFTDGTNDWPQTYGGGPSLYMVKSLLENPPSNWLEYAKAQLNPEDRSTIMIEMTKRHRGHNVNVAHPAQAKEGDKSPSDERIDQLYNASRDESLLPIKRYIDWLQGRETDFRNDTLTDSDLGLIQTFFSDQKNAAKVQELKAIIDQTYDDTHVPEAAQLRLAFRAASTRRTPFPTWLNQHPIHKEILTKNNIPLDSSPGQVRVYTTQIVREKVIGSVSAKFPKVPIPSIIGRVLPRAA